MYRILSLFILLSLTTQVYAQKYKKPEQYFREFQTQKRKINKKNLIYLKSSLRGDDERKVAKYREMMIDQLKDSKAELSRIGDYEGYDILQREFVNALSMYIDAYEKDFGIAEELTKNRYNSYEDLKKYYDAVTKAEGEMLDASYKMEKAEDHFAKMHFFTIERDEEIEEEYRLLDEVTLYTRDLTLSFFRVEQHSKNFLSAVNDGKTDTLGDILNQMAKDLRVSKAEVDAYESFEGNKSLYKMVDYFLEEMTIELQDNLRPLADMLENKYLEDKEYKKTQKDLERFIGRHNQYLEDFFETKRELILDYLPEE